ncbi:hypothetical protein ETAA8_60650 [Anatilimnocola aggregata]|uniref:Antitoxin n=1 Tax=Anatilimnocola aggregata TaxID=2528021 RepID=A0A517YL13_9BACT|nr:type II toxin-antitoxin system prevent-host-death family antitoxin [Anatilimnocola aggregata]QDU30912.1 hypothetical protein ETAA8_60650 [Anatilimnocola aggregata]
MRTDIEIQDLSARLDEALALANAGEEVILVANGAPKAKLVPVESAGGRVFDLHPGAFVVGPEFDDPLSDDVWPNKR